MNSTPGSPGRDHGVPPTARDGVGLALPADALYWAVLAPIPGLARGRRARGSAARTEALRYAFEPWLPVALDEVEARFVTLGDGRTLACGIESRRLDEAIGGADPASVVPAALPECVRREIGSAQVDLSALEFRSGAFVSPRARRRAAALQAAAVCSLCVSLLTLAAGMQQGAARDRRDAAAARDAASRLAVSALGLDTAAAARGPAPELRLAAEVRALQRTRVKSGLASGSPSRGEVEGAGGDRTADLLALLGGWPESIPVRVESIVLDRDSLALRGVVRDAGDFERLTLGLGESLRAWSPQAKSAAKAREGYSFALTLQRSSPPPPPPATAPRVSSDAATLHISKAGSP